MLTVIVCEAWIIVNEISLYYFSEKKQPNDVSSRQMRFLEVHPSKMNEKI